MFVINGKDRAIFIYLNFKFSIMNGIEKGDSSTSPLKDILADLTVKDVERLKDYYVEEAKRLMAFFRFYEKALADCRAFVARIALSMGGLYTGTVR